MDELVPYERARERNIARNREIMLALGLTKHDACMHAEASGSGRDGTKKMKSLKTVGANEDKKHIADASTRVRRSTRARNVVKVDVKEERVDVAEEDADADESNAELHRAAAEAHAARNAGRQGRAALVGTASYQHTLMRVRTMRDEDKLRRRMKTIESARGKHAVTKMRLFARVLFLEGYERLAGECVESLEFLISELGDPEEEEMVRAQEDVAREAAANAEGFHCDAKTDLSDLSVFADVTRIEAKAAEGENDENDARTSEFKIANANRWQAAAASLAGADGTLRGSGNVITLSEDGAYHVERATSEMKHAIKKARKR